LGHQFYVGAANGRGRYPRAFFDFDERRRPAAGSYGCAIVKANAGWVALS
jgi:hypothetical protein